MKTIKGPAIFLAQFVSDDTPFYSLAAIADWASSCGFTGVQMPSWDNRLFDLGRAANSKDYCDEVSGVLGDRGIELMYGPTVLHARIWR